MIDVLVPPLLAAAQDVLYLIVGLAVLVIWVIGQISEARKQQRRGERAELGVPRRAQPPPDQADQLRHDVEEFLRQAERGDAQQPAPRQARPQRPQRPPQRPPRRHSSVEVLVGDDPAALEAEILEPPRRAGQKQPLQLPTPVPSKAASTPPYQSVSSHAELPMGTRTFGLRSSHLGERVALADDQMEAHLHATFDHAVGRLAGPHAADAYKTRAAENSIATQIASMLTSPDGVRQAVVLNEVLTRPDQRWE